MMLKYKFVSHYIAICHFPLVSCMRTEIYLHPRLFKQHLSSSPPVPEKNSSHHCQSRCQCTLNECVSHW